MPVREYKRLWCKHCQNWELFEQHYPNWEDWFCKKCENVHEKTPLSEIPEEQLLEQRKRYIEWHSKEINKIFGEIMMSPEDHALKEFMHMFGKPGEEVIITESDAGQNAIDEQKRKKRAEEMAKYREEKERMKEYLIKYKGIQRNETCPCGSGKKYKKCCLQDVENKLQEYNLRF